MTGNQIRIVLKNDLSEIERLGRELEAFGKQCGLPAKTLFELNLILEEIVANVIAYAYPDPHHHEIVVKAAVDQGEIALEVEDDGRPFDPRQAPKPEFGRSVQEIKVGGLGLHLVQKLADSVAYERSGGKNRLSIKKRADPGGESGRL